MPPATVADIPTVFDIVINGVGYMFDKRREDQALMGHTPTFVPRNNNSGVYGDNEQDFFLTGSQKDWSGGSEQRHWAADEEHSNRFWDSMACEIHIPGEIRLSQKPRVNSIESIYAGCGRFDDTAHFLASATTAYTVYDSIVTSMGAHGAGTPFAYGVCTDGRYHYVSGLSGIRKWDGITWSDFALGNFGSIAYLNNQLYACDGINLVVFSSTGVPTTLYSWVNATGVAYQRTRVKVITYGSNLLVYMRMRSANRPELWMFDGESTFRVAQLPIGVGGDAVESNGIVFLSSAELSNQPSLSGTTWPVGVIYAWVNGSIQEAWRDDRIGNSQIPALQEAIPTLGLLAGNLIFSCTNKDGRFLKQYNLETGSTETITTWVSETGSAITTLFISSSLGSICLVGQDVDATVWPAFAGFSDSGTLDSSLYDFGSSLKKLFRSVRIDFETPAVTSVNVSYRLDTLEGAYTAVAGPIVSGVDIPLPDNLIGNSISIRVTLTTGISTSTPVVRRLYVRAAPFHQSYRKAVYHLDLSSYRGDTPVMRRDGSADARTGKDMAAALYAIVTGQASVPIIDSLGSYTGILDPDGFQITQFNPDEYVATVSVRQV